MTTPKQQHILDAARENDMNFSAVAKQLNLNVGYVSRVCRRFGIESEHKEKALSKSLPTKDIVQRYQDGQSALSLAEEHGASINLIIRKLKKAGVYLGYNGAMQRQRPDLLNDPERLSQELQNKSATKIAQDLGVKTQTVLDNARRLFLDNHIATTEYELDESAICDAYANGSSLTELSKSFEVSVTAIQIRLRRHDVAMRPAGGRPKPSKYELLNDKEWLAKRYGQDKASLLTISLEVGCAMSTVKYYLEKYGIELRDKAEGLKLMRSRQPYKGTFLTKAGVEIRYDSKQELKFLQSLPPTAKINRDPCDIHYKGLVYSPDFEVDGDIVEIKSRSTSLTPGVSRIRLMKQLGIAKRRNVNVKVWADKYVDIPTITDLDKYYAANWSVYFDSAQEIYEFLCEFGFQPLEFPIDRLLKAIKQRRVPEQYRLSSNYSRVWVTDFLKHFNHHYWYSHHKNMLPVSVAFDVGNRVILRNAVNKLFDRNSKSPHNSYNNIYGLVRCIRKNFKDFMDVSLFKPWIADYVYERYLPNGGVVVDPCMGWGGRFFAAAFLDIEYHGFDLNSKAVTSHKAMSKFLGKQKVRKPSFKVADATSFRHPACDLIFTSPPYDDTEHYDGLDDHCVDSQPIYDNLFDQQAPLVVLNVPLRHQMKVVETGRRHGYSVREVLKMKTASLGRFDKAHEPIIAFVNE